MQLRAASATVDTGSTLTQILLEKRRLHVVPIDGVAPSLATLKDGTYRYRKSLFFVIGSTPSPLADRFCSSSSHWPRKRG